MATKQAYKDGDRLQMPLLLAPPDPDSYTPIRTPGERKYLGCMVNGHGQLILPSAIAWQAIPGAHQSTHYGQEALYQWLIKSMTTLSFWSLLKHVVEA